MHIDYMQVLYMCACNTPIYVSPPNMHVFEPLCLANIFWTDMVFWRAWRYTVHCTVRSSSREQPTYRCCVHLTSPATVLALFCFNFFLQNGHCSIFICIWQILSNHRLTKFKKFVSQITVKVCNQFFLLFIFNTLCMCRKILCDEESEKIYNFFWTKQAQWCSPLHVLFYQERGSGLRIWGYFTLDQLFHSTTGQVLYQVCKDVWLEVLKFNRYSSIFVLFDN